MPYILYYLLTKGILITVKHSQQCILCNQLLTQTHVIIVLGTDYFDALFRIIIAFITNYAIYSATKHNLFTLRIN